MAEKRVKIAGYPYPNPVFSVILRDTGRIWVILGDFGTPGDRRFAVYRTSEHMFFLGEFHHSLDEYGRLTLPAAYRALLPEDVFIVHGLDENLMVLPPQRFHVLYRQLQRLSLTDPKARQLRRLMFASAAQTKVDRAGRIRIPVELRERAGLEKDVVIVGVGDYFELWTPDAWKEQLRLLEDAEANAQRFAVFHLALSEDGGQASSGEAADRPDAGDAGASPQAMGGQEEPGG